MPAESVSVQPLKHPLHALTTYELKDRRRELERAITGIAPGARRKLPCAERLTP